MQTETVLRQALGERIKPVLTVNKIDRCFLELMQDPEEAFLSYRRVIENANVIMATYSDEALGDIQVTPEKGNVCFSAGLHGWAFTMTVFSKFYAKKFGVEEKKMMERLWGDNFFDQATKKWTKKDTGAATCKRGFCQFVYEPIKQVIEACMNDNKDKLFPMLEKLGVKLSKEDREKTGKPLMKRVMQVRNVKSWLYVFVCVTCVCKRHHTLTAMFDNTLLRLCKHATPPQTWLPAHEALLEMMIFHLPSPADAQKYRVDVLYEGPLDDPYATAIRNCDADGPMMVYVSKMIPAPDKGRFYAFGRVFSGRVRGFDGSMLVPVVGGV